MTTDIRSANSYMYFDVTKYAQTTETVMNFSARRAFQSLCMGIFVIALLHVIVYQWKPPQKAGQFNFARKINEVLNGDNRELKNHDEVHDDDVC